MAFFCVSKNTKNAKKRTYYTWKCRKLLYSKRKRCNNITRILGLKLSSMEKKICEVEFPINSTEKNSIVGIYGEIETTGEINILEIEIL